MNTQRWLVLGVVGIVVALFLTRPLWQPPSEEEIIEEELPTPTPPSLSVNALPNLLTQEDQPSPPPTLPQLSLGMTLTTVMGTPQATPVVTDKTFILARGNFVEIDPMHGGEGTATIYQTPEGIRFLRLEPFSVASSPDLHVLLANHPAPRTSGDLLPGEFTDLGTLQSDKGPQNYDIPLGLRLEIIESVVIYCQSFDIVFTTATLER